MGKWFICNNDVVDGPFTKEEISMKVQSDQYPNDILIWGKDMNVWKPYQWWLENYDTILSEAAKSKDPRLWHFAYKGDSQGPLDRSDLIEELKKLQGDANDALIWTKGMTNWAPLYEFHDIMDDVGVNRRNFPRAPIEGQVILHHGDTLIHGDLSSVSEGGIGSKNFDDELAAGLVVKLEIHSDHFDGPIHASAQIRYMSEGTIGFKFTHINRESQARIIDYVKEKNFEMINSLKAA